MNKAELAPNSKQVLDACCGSRMFWFDKKNPVAVFMDKRVESHKLCDGRELIVDPDVVADFTDMPFGNSRFALVVFDPPHLANVGSNAWMSKKYGRLESDWQKMLRDGFRECFRVLKDCGVLIFKWNETQIPVSKILELTPEQPLFGHRSGKQSKTHWIVFIKKKGQNEQRIAKARDKYDVL